MLVAVLASVLKALFGSSRPVVEVFGERAEVSLHFARRG